MACIVSALAIYIRFPETFSLQELSVTCPLYLALALVMQSLMIPFQLKFGGEKSRLALILFFIGIFLAGSAVVKVLAMAGIDLDAVLTSLTLPGALVFALGVLAASLLFFLASLLLSIRIVEKKDF